MSNRGILGASFCTPCRLAATFCLTACTISINNPKPDEGSANGDLQLATRAEARLRFGTSTANPGSMPIVGPVAQTGGLLYPLPIPERLPTMRVFSSRSTATAMPWPCGIRTAAFSMRTVAKVAPPGATRRSSMPSGLTTQARLRSSPMGRHSRCGGSSRVTPTTFGQRSTRWTAAGRRRAGSSPSSTRLWTTPAILNSSSTRTERPSSRGCRMQTSTLRLRHRSSFGWVGRALRRSKRVRDMPERRIDLLSTAARTVPLEGTARERDHTTSPQSSPLQASRTMSSRFLSVSRYRVFPAV